MKIITEQQIRSLAITPRQCVEWIHESFAMKHEAQLPAKISVHPADYDFFTSMPCLLPDNGGDIRFFGIKEVHRIEGAVPSLGSDIMLYNAKNGELLALMDGDWITTMRTGAVAAASAKALRKSNASVYGFVGLGNTARASLLCILEAEPEKQFKVNSISELAQTVDVFISCITSANGLLVEDEKIFQPGVTVIPVHMRGLQNCDTTFDRVFGDDTDHVKGFKYFSQFRDYNEIGEVLSGRDPGRKSDKQRILDYNYGLALHDIVFASKLYEALINTDTINIPIHKETDKFWI